MELKITTLDGEEKGSVNLSDAIFGLEPRQDLIHPGVLKYMREVGILKSQGKS